MTQDSRYALRAESDYRLNRAHASHLIRPWINPVSQPVSIGLQVKALVIVVTLAALAALAGCL